MPPAPEGGAPGARRAHEMPFGATLLEGGGARLRLWAPAARTVEVELHGAFMPAMPLPGGWWQADAPRAVAGQRYRFHVDGLAVPDPASRFNPDGPHAASELIDPRAFAWDDGDWRGRPWHEVVLYELHVGSFTREGTFAAAQAQLEGLARLGITAVQLMPLADFPGRFGWGYDGVLHYAPHAAYGRPDDVKRFVQAAHALGLMVFVDVVYNHFGPDGNYLHAYAPQFFSQQHDSPWGRAINFDGEGSRTVRDFFIHNALYWLEEFHVDGLRLDAVHAIVDGSAQHVLQELSVRARAHLPGRHIHLVVEDDHNDTARLSAVPRPGRYDGQWTGDFHHILHVLLTGEGGGYYEEFREAWPHGTLEQLARCLANGTAWLGAPPVARQGRARPASFEAAPLLAIVNFLQNHDQVGNRAFGERLAPLALAQRPDAGEAPLALATALLLLAPHTPMLFMGQEWNAATPFLYFADWQGDLRRAVTEGRRREFPQFHTASGGSVVPDPCDEATFRASALDRTERERAEAVQWQSFVSHLLALRQSALVPRLPRLAPQGHTAEVIEGRGLWVRWHFDARDGEPACVLEMGLNFSGAVLAVPALAGVHGAGEGVSVLYQQADAEQGYLAPWGGHWRWREEVRA